MLRSVFRKSNDYLTVAANQLIEQLEVSVKVDANISRRVMCVVVCQCEDTT